MSAADARSQEGFATSIPARDGFALAATVFEPRATWDGRVAVIQSATAVPRAFYRRFAEFLAERGYRALTFDYRGIGGSRPVSLRGFEARMRDWGLLDMSGVLRWTLDTWSPRPLVVIGHSVGGQLVGLLPEANRIDALVTTSAQSGYWRLQGGAQKIAVLLYMYLAFPVLPRLLGYFPWRFAGGEDLPRGVALEWARWCRSRNYLFDDETLPGRERYGAFRAPILAFSFEDDAWGTRRSVDDLMGHYTGARLERRHVVPGEVGVERIGHMGFYRPACRPLWEECADWLARVPPR